MFSHIMVGVSDFERALTFYQPVLDALGVQFRFQSDERPWAGWQSSPDPRPLLLIGTAVQTIALSLVGWLFYTQQAGPALLVCVILFIAAFAMARSRSLWSAASVSSCGSLIPIRVLDDKSAKASGASSSPSHSGRCPTSLRYWSMMAVQAFSKRCEVVLSAKLVRVLMW